MDLACLLVVLLLQCRSILCLHLVYVLSLWCFYRESLWLLRFLLVDRMFVGFFPSFLCEWNRQIVMSLVGFCPYAFKDSADGQYLWGRGSISSEAILVFPNDVVDFGFYVVSCVDYVLWTSIRENGFELTKKRGRGYPAKTITDADYADDIAILVNKPNQAETLLHSLERAAAGIGIHINAHKTEYMCYNQTSDITTLEETPLKLVDKFTYRGSSVSSTEKFIDTRLTKAWRAINRLPIIWKSDLTDKIKHTFFQVAVVSILLYGCTSWMLTKWLEKKLYSNYTRMLRAILSKSWRQHRTRHQLYGHLPPNTKTIKVRRNRHAGRCWRSRDELINDVLLWTPTYSREKAGRPPRTYIQQLCEDTGCSPADLTEEMKDREKWRERVRDIRASGTIWWWWWWWLLLNSINLTGSSAFTTIWISIGYTFFLTLSVYLMSKWFFFKAIM